MKTFSKILCACAAIAAAAAHAADGAGEFDRASAEGAAELVLRELSREVLEGGKSAEPLGAKMLADPGAYRRREKAKKDLEQDFLRDLEARYASEAAKVLERLARPRKVEDAFSAGFLKEASALDKEDTAKSLREKYGRVFDAARKAACEAQAATLQAKVRPTEREVDSMPAERLRETLAARISENQDKPVFEENISYISERLAGPMVDEALRQRKSQQDSVRRTRVDGYAPSVLEANLARHVRIFVAERKRDAKDGEWVYSIFPSVTNETVRTQARKVSLSRAADAAAEAEIGEGAEELIGKAIEEDAAKHVRREESLKTFEPMFAAELREAAMKDVFARAPESEKAEFREFVEANAERGEFADKVRERVRNEFLPLVVKVRDAMAKRQFADFHPLLADGTWFPGGDLVDRVCGSHEYRQLVQKWRELDGVEGAKGGGEAELLLEEAVKLADDSVAANFERARSARTFQLGLVEPAAKAVGEELAAKKKAGGKVELQDAVAALTEAVKKDWSGKREEVVWKCVPEEKRPSNADAHFAELFPSVVKKIEEAAKKILERLAEPDPEEKPPQDTPPEEEKLEVECEVRFERRGDDKVAIVLVEDGKRFASFDFSDYRRNYRKNLAAALYNVRLAMGERLSRISGKEGAKLTLTISVADEYMYFGTVSETIEALRAAAESSQIGTFSTVSPLGQ